MPTSVDLLSGEWAESSPMLVEGHWLPIRDADPRARALYRAHYSCHHYRDGRRPAKFIGVGSYQALLTLDCLALWVAKVWRDPSGETGVYNAIFRNESPVRSSDLIREACELGWQRWPGERFYTYVNPAKIKSPHPGYCYLMAGWRYCRDAAGRPRRTPGGLLVLEMLPEWSEV